MKLQLDTANKTIKLEDDIELGEFVEKIKKLLPDGEWKKFTLKTNVTIQHWTEPYIIKTYPIYHNRDLYPWYKCYGTSSNRDLYPWYKCYGSSSNRTNAVNTLLKSGVYNVQLT